jgi:hypothetical protein
MKHIHLFLVCMTLAAANYVSGQIFSVPYTYTFDSPPDVPTWNFPTSGSMVSGRGLLNTSPSGTFAYGTYIDATPASTPNDMMIRAFGPAVGLTLADWTASVSVNLSLSVGASQKASLFLAAANNDHAFAISLDKTAGGTNANTYMDFVVNSVPIASAASTTLTLNYVLADKKIYALVGSSPVGSWDVASYYGVEGSFFTFSLGGMTNGNLPVDFYSNTAYLNDFTLNGAGIIAAGGGPGVPEPSTYAAIMGLAAMGVASQESEYVK